MRANQVGLKPTRADILLSAAIILLCAALVLALFLIPKDAGDRVIVEVNGEPYGDYALNENRQLDIGGHNLLVIEDGHAYMESADCPDKSCTRQAAVDAHGGSIICLPNRVVVTVAASSDGVDAVAGGG